MRRVRKSKVDILKKTLEKINRGRWKATPKERILILTNILKLTAEEERNKK